METRPGSRKVKRTNRASENLCFALLPSPVEFLVRPKPPKGGRGQQAEDESIEDFLQGHSPCLALPDAIAQMSQAVGEERRGTCHAENHQIVCAGRDRVPREISDEETDDQAISKPHPEELGHGGWTTGKHG